MLQQLSKRRRRTQRAAASAAARPAHRGKPKPRAPSAADDAADADADAALPASPNVSAAGSAATTGAAAAAADATPRTLKRTRQPAHRGTPHDDQTRRRLQRLRDRCRAAELHVPGLYASPNLQQRWRRDVTKWMLEFGGDFNLENDVIAVAVAYFDLFFSRTDRVVLKDDIQLWAMVCVLVASKLHQNTEVSFIAEELHQLADGEYAVTAIVAAELVLLKTLRWNLHIVTSHHIMRYVATFVDTSVRGDVLKISEGLCDYALTEFGMLAHSRTSVATAAVLSGLCVLRLSAVGSELLRKLEEDDIVPAARHSEIEGLVSTFTAAYRKDHPDEHPHAGIPAVCLLPKCPQTGTAAAEGECCSCSNSSTTGRRSSPSSSGGGGDGGSRDGCGGGGSGSSGGGDGGSGDDRDGGVRTPSGGAIDPSRWRHFLQPIDSPAVPVHHPPGPRPRKKPRTSVRL